MFYISTKLHREMYYSNIAENKHKHVLQLLYYVQTKYQGKAAY
jgi:hypothetical protein